MIEWQPDRIWYQTGKYSHWGISIGLRMTIFRLANGGLLVHNPIELTESLKDQLAKLGHIQGITTVNTHLHHYLSDWWLTYPDAYFYAAPGLEAKRTDIGFDAPLSTQSQPLWRDDLLQTVFTTYGENKDIIFCDPVTKTLVFGTVFSHLNRGTLLTQFAGLLTGRYFEPATTPSTSMYLEEKTQIRQSLQEVLSWPFESILPIHGQPIAGEGKKHIIKAFSWALNG
ncbi:DUF4336 domain-containing protein [Veronia pacifica]|uniref:Methanol oxidase n=1 Tax=Veronia pacifica TaxID=1080227 RepID=A0A1C3EKL7_9GAMM|nr:DUF4336 domain-containing protein [Veronia pacifica]ODA33770.1 methanol oxidase [Veronia pacifica]